MCLGGAAPHGARVSNDIMMRVLDTDCRCNEGRGAVGQRSHGQAGSRCVLLFGGLPVGGHALRLVAQR